MRIRRRQISKHFSHQKLPNVIQKRLTFTASFMVVKINVFLHFFISLKGMHIFLWTHNFPSVRKQLDLLLVTQEIYLVQQIQSLDKTLPLLALTRCLRKWKYFYASRYLEDEFLPLATQPSLTHNECCIFPDLLLRQVHNGWRRSSSRSYLPAIRGRPKKASDKATKTFSRVGTNWKNHQPNKYVRMRVSLCTRTKMHYQITAHNFLPKMP